MKCYNCEKQKKNGDYVSRGIWVCAKCQAEAPSEEQQFSDYAESCARQGVNATLNEFEKM